MCRLVLSSSSFRLSIVFSRTDILCNASCRALSCRYWSAAICALSNFNSLHSSRNLLFRRPASRAFAFQTSTPDVALWKLAVRFLQEERPDERTQPLARAEHQSPEALNANLRSSSLIGSARISVNQRSNSECLSGTARSGLQMVLSG